VVPVLIYALTGNPVYTLAVGVGAIILPKFAFRWMAKRRLQEFEAALPDAIAQIAGSMRAGATLPIAIEAIFERLASTLREKAAMEGKIRALTAQGKLQGWVVGLLPVGMILILYQMEPEAMYPLLNSVLGWGFVAVMVVLELMGLFMIKKIVTIDV